MTTLPNAMSNTRVTTQTIPRRQFLKTAATAGAGLTILPGGALAGPSAPSNRLNGVLIGVGGRGRAHFGAVKD